MRRFTRGIHTGQRAFPTARLMAGDEDKRDKHPDTGSSPRIIKPLQFNWSKSGDADWSPYPETPDPDKTDTDKPDAGAADPPVSEPDRWTGRLSAQGTPTTPSAAEKDASPQGAGQRSDRPRPSQLMRPASTVPYERPANGRTGNGASAPTPAAVENASDDARSATGGK